MSDDLDIEWGNDPFDGDIDFDSDFDTDPYADKGFVGGLVSGYLNGLVESSVSPQAISRTVRSILPDSYSNAFDRFDRVKWRVEELAREFREENYETVKSLQNIASKLADRAEGNLSDSTVGRLRELSEKDFSSWEKWSSSGEQSNDFEEGSDDDTNRLIQGIAESQENTMSVFTRTVNEMSAYVGSGIQSAIGAGNRQLINIETNVRDLMDYQRNVQSKIEQAKLNLLARTYVTNVKYYKFMERGIHSEIAELKKIAKASYMSDFQKTSMFTSGREYMRNRLFTTVAERSGGIFNKLGKAFGEENRKDTYGTIADMIGGLSDAMDMADGFTLSRGMIGEYLGKMMADNTIAGIPRFFKYGGGKKIIDRLRAKYPDHAKELDKMVNSVTDVGNIISYASTGGMGMVNHVAENYTVMDEMKFVDYDDYVDSLKPGQKPLPKAIWEITNFASNKSKTMLNDFMLDIGKTKGTDFELRRYRPEDLMKVAPWTNMESKSLNVVIPGLLSAMHTSLEQIRTGDDSARGLVYNHSRGSMMRQEDNKRALKADLLNANEFSRYSSAALQIVETIDPEKTLSGGARKELALAIAKNVDQEKGFNPFYYIGNVKGISKKNQKEITGLMMRYFGIDADHVAGYESAEGLAKLKFMGKMPTTEGNERLNKISASAEYMKEYFPNISSRIDLLRNTGNEQILRDMGLVINDNGVDKVNMDAFYDRLAMFMDDPKNPDLRAKDITSDTTLPGKTKGLGGVLDTDGIVNALKPITDRLEGITGKFDGVTDKLGNVGDKLGTVSDSLKAIADKLDIVIGKNTIADKRGNKKIATQLGAVADNFSETTSKLLESLNKISEMKPQQLQMPDYLKELKGIGGKFDSIVTNTGGTHEELQSLNTKFGEFYEIVKQGKLFARVLDDNSGKPKSDKEKNELDKAKKSIWEKIKGYVPKNFTGRALDLITENQPLILGTLLGGIGAHFIENPWLAGGVALAGAGLGLFIQKSKFEKQTGDEPSDNEDILDANGIPLLTAKNLNAGYYLDAITKKVIKTWGDIKGPVYNFLEKRVIDIVTLSGKIFGADGRAVVLKGLSKARQVAVDAWNYLDPISQIRKGIKFGKDLLLQQNVFVPGEKSPRLLGERFKVNAYYCLDESGKPFVLTGWHDINGAVYNSEGKMLITEEEYNAGLVTSSGVSIRKVGGMLKRGKDLLSKFVKTKTDETLNRFGYSKDGGEVNEFGRLTGVEERLDKIYDLLCKQFGYEPDGSKKDGPYADEPPSDGNGPEPSGGPSGGSGAPNSDERHPAFGSGFGNPDGSNPGTGHSTIGGKEITSDRDGDGLMDPRQNSLADQRRQEEIKRKEKVDETIINIGDYLRPKEEEDPKKDKSLFGMLKNFAMAGLPMLGKFLKNPFWMVTSLIKTPGFFKTLGTIGTGLFGPLLGLTSPLFKMLKTGIVGLGKILLGKKAADGLGGGLDLGEGGGGRGRGGKRKWLKRGGKAALFAGGIYAANELVTKMAGSGSPVEDIGFDDMFNPAENQEEARAKEQDTNNFEKAFDNVTDIIPQTALAKAGMDIVLGEEKVNWLKNHGLFWTSDYKFFFSREEAGRHEATLGKGNDKQITTQKRIRFAQYGIKNLESTLAQRVMDLEISLIDYVVIKDNRASLRADAPVDKLFNQFAKGGDYRNVGDLKTWFLARFKPVFMVYASGVYVAKFGDVFEYDRSREYDSVLVADRVQQALTTLDPYPYSIDVRIDNTEPLMNEVQTREYVKLLTIKLKKEIPKPKEADDVIKTSEDEAAQSVRSDGVSWVPFSGDGGKSKEALMQNAIKATKESNLVSQIKTPAQAKLIDISDLHKDSTTVMDPFVMARLSVYGNTDNNPGRVDAVLRLERYVEDLILVVGKESRFAGKIEDVFDLFGPSFRVYSYLDKLNWICWFRDRFLPTAIEYVKQVHKYRNGKPAKVWQQLSATNRSDIARALFQQIVYVDGKEKSVWEIAYSPFPGTKSGTETSAIDKYLKILDSRATTAALKEPELEAESTKSFAERKANKYNGDTVRNNTQNAINEVYKTGSVMNKGSYGTNGGGTGTTNGYSSSGTYQSGYNTGKTFNYQDLSGSAGNISGEVTGEFNPEFIKLAGEDKGIKMSPEQGEQLLLRHLVKAGIKDIKTLALALAMAKKESGNYSTTVENTNWKAPALRKYFKNIPDEATAQKVAAMPAPERAMWVYGRAPKGPQLGNTKPEDGWLYRGRGLFQVTGKANYERYKKETGVDVVKDPKLMSEDPNVIADSAVRFLKNSKAMMAISKTGDFESAMRGINGGNAVPGSDERRKYYVEYLNRLKSGELGLGGIEGAEDTADSGDPAAPNQTAGATGGPQSPSKPDNPDPGFVDTTAGVVGSKPVSGAGNADDVKAVKPGDTKKLLDEGGLNGSTTNTASTTPQGPADQGSGTPSAPASPVPAVAKASASSEDKPKDESSPSSSSAGSTKSSAPMETASVPVSTPAPEPKPTPVKERPVETPAPVTANVNMPDSMVVSDPVTQNLLRDLIKLQTPGRRGVNVS